MHPKNGLSKRRLLVVLRTGFRNSVTYYILGKMHRLTSSDSKTFAVVVSPVDSIIISDTSGSRVHKFVFASRGCLLRFSITKIVSIGHYLCQ